MKVKAIQNITQFSKYISCNILIIWECVFALSIESARQLVERTYGEYYRGMELLKGKMGAGDFDALVSLLEKANQILLEEKEHG